MHDADARGQTVDLGQDVARHQDGRPSLTCERAQELSNLYDPGWVEPVRRFVENQQFRVVEQGAGKSEPLEVAERERPRRTARVLTEPELLNSPVHGRPVARVLETPGHFEVLAYGESWIRGRAFHKMADPSPQAGRLGVDAPAEQLGVPGGR